MIARVYVLLPYSLTVPEGETFNIYSYMDEGCEVRVYPPAKSDVPPQPDYIKDIQIKGVPAFRANVLRVDFVKDSFDRRQDIECDPPFLFIRRTVNSFLSKLRFVTRGGYIKPIDFPNTTWRIEYLNDNGTELPKAEGLFRGRAGRRFEISWTGVNSQIWEDTHQLPHNYSPPEWHALLLDATVLLPEVGPAIVLAMTALEVFISQILDALAEKSSIPEKFWRWLSDRKRQSKATIEEQFDSLFKVLSGVSLKEDKELWQKFKHLQEARNKFVHTGVVKVSGRALNQGDAGRLVSAAGEIIHFIRERLPDDLKWPEYQYKFDVETSFNPFGG
jgi:hypothetical protein